MTSCQLNKPDVLVKPSSVRETRTLELFLDGTMVGSWETSPVLDHVKWKSLEKLDCLVTENLSKVRVWSFSTRNVSQVTAWTLFLAWTDAGLLKPLKS